MIKELKGDFGNELNYDLFQEIVMQNSPMLESPAPSRRPLGSFQDVRLSKFLE